MESSDDIPSKEKVQTSRPTNFRKANSEYLIDLDPIPPKDYFDLIFQKNLQGFLKSEKKKAEIQSDKVAPTPLLDDDLAPAKAPGVENGIGEVKVAPEDSGSSINGLESKATNELVTEYNPYDLYGPLDRFPSPQLLPTDQKGAFDDREPATSKATDKPAESPLVDIDETKSQKGTELSNHASMAPSKPLTAYRLDIPEALLPDLRRDPRFTGYCHAWIHRPDFCGRGISCIFKHQFPPGAVEEFGVISVHNTRDGKSITKPEEETAVSRAGPGRTRYLNPGAEEFTPGCYSQACIAFSTTGYCKHNDRCWYQHLDARNHEPWAINSLTGTRSRYQAAETPFLLPSRADSPTAIQKQYQAAETPLPLRASSPTEIQRHYQAAETSFPLPLRASSPIETRGRYHAVETTLANADTNKWDAFVARSLSEFNATQIANGLELSIHRPRNSNFSRVGRNATLAPRNSYGGQISTSRNYKVGRIATANPRSTYDTRIATHNFDDVIHVATATPRRSQDANLNTSIPPPRSSNDVIHIATAATHNPNDVIHIAKATPAQKAGRSSPISTTPAAPPPSAGKIATNGSSVPAVSSDAPAATYNLLDSNAPATPMNDILVPTPARTEKSRKPYNSWDDAPPKEARALDFWVGKPAIVVERPRIVASEAQAKSYVIVTSPVERPEPHLNGIDRPVFKNTRVSPFDKGWEKLIDI